MASSYSINFLLFCSLLFPIISSSIAQTTSFRPKALLLRVTKDSSTLQYITNINQRTPLVPVKLTLDLGGQFLWVDCEQGYVSSTYKPARCRSAQCNLAQSKACGECYSGPKPGCNNDTCSLFPDNTITRTSTSGELAQDVISIQSTDGSNPGKVVSVPNLLFTCGATFLLEGLASGVKGMAGLGRTKIGLPSQFAAAFSLKRKFAICLSSSSTSNGVIFFGDSPYVFLPGIDVSDSLIYTPLFINPVSTAGSYFEGEKSAEYFIGVKSIKIGEKAVPVNTSLLSIDSNGIGGTKISTVNPYTVLHTSIHNSVVNAFVNSLANVPRVAAVAPFGACFNSSNIGSTRVGPAVPAIDLVLQSNDVYWRIFGANSMVQVRDDVLCLGFVDGGVEPRTSIVIGGHQLEDNLLQFDLAYNRLGFSSSLFFRRTTCANFNFTRSYFEGEKSAEYFIGVKSITINEKVVPVNTSFLSLDSNGIGGTKISTVNPYTVLHASIYNSVVNAFVNSLANVPRVAAVAPFGACSNSNNIGSTPVGPAVPDIDLVLQSNDVYWRIFGANSMVQVRDDVLCLGFVDGGVEPRTSIVIGGHQLEDNLLQFDFAYNRLGFSSSLFFKQTTCSK